MKPSLIVHGGAWDIPDEAVEACNNGCRNALEAGWAILASGGSALEAVEASIITLEDDPVFDAGYGSHLNRDGEVECDAIVMDGASLRAGAAAGLHRLKNPIRLARKILEECPHMMLIAEGAERFAKDSGLALCKPEELVSDAPKAIQENDRLPASREERRVDAARGVAPRTQTAAGTDVAAPRRRTGIRRTGSSAG